MIEVHLYGNLRRLASASRPSDNSVVKLQLNTGDTVGAVLQRLGIGETDLTTIFLNRKMFTTRNSMANWLGYIAVRQDRLEWDLDWTLNDGDRLGLFGSDMPALVV